MRVAVTGGAGYIGSTLIRNLLHEGHEIISLDNQTIGDYKYLRRLKTKHANLLEGDVRDSKKLDFAFKGADAIVHMAALSDLEVCNEKPEEAVSVNVYGTLQVVEAAQRNCVRRLVFCSSAAVYGAPASIPVTERHALHPINLYGITKLGGEKIINAGHHNYGVETINLRFGNVYGVGIFTNWIGVIPKFVSLAIEGKPLTVYGDGTSTRDFVHVEDIARVISISLSKNKIGGETFNIGNETTTIKEIADIISKEVEIATGKKVKIVYLSPRTGETKEFSYNTAKIRHALGFVPKWKLRDGIEQIVKHRLASQKIK